MQRRHHPSHHIPVLIVPTALFAGLLTMAVALGMTLEDRMLLFIIIGVMAVTESVAGIIVVLQMLKKCQCPGCNQILDRDPDPTTRGIEFPCTTCEAVWVSKIGGGSVDAS